MNDPNLKDLMERHRTTVMQVKGVVGMAIGLSRTDPSRRCVQIYVTSNDWPEGLPQQLEGYEVELVKTSGFRAT